MNFKEFEKELVARKHWKNGIRIIAYDAKGSIFSIGEFQTIPMEGYYNNFIRKGKKVAVHIRRFFETDELENATKISFEEIPKE